MTRLRILFVTNNYTPYSGGVVSSISAFTDELRRQGHEVFIVSLDFLGEKHVDPDFVFRLPCPIKFLYNNNHMAFPFRSYCNMKELVLRIRPHIIHSHHPFLLGKTAVKIAYECALPIIFTYHTLYEYRSYYVPLPSFIVSSLITHSVLRYCNQVSGIVAPSPTVSNYLIDQKVKPLIEIIPSGLRSFLEPASEFSQKDLFVNRSCRLLSVNRFNKEKNIYFLIDLIARLKQLNRRYHMTLIGYGPLWNTVQKYAYNQLALTPDHIHFVHRPDNEHLAYHYRNADLFIFSSQSETQGLVLAEAMAAGTPVIALDGAGQRDIIKQGKNGFIVDGMDTMIGCMESLVDDQLKMNKMQYHSWKTAHNYTASRVTDRLTRFYKQFLKS